MTEEELRELVSRYLKNQCSSKERALIDALFDSYRKENGQETDRSIKMENLKHEMFQNIRSEIKKKKRAVLPKILKIAASVILVIGIGLTSYLIQQEPEIELITKSTGRGQKATIRLSDGSIVRLNAESSINYPKSFSKDSREVELKGEAYFDVKEDLNKPFIVTTYDIQTTVLGTSFNINSIDSSYISVALITGKVKVHLPEKNSSEVYLVPGEGAFYHADSGKIDVDSFNQKALTAWKDGIIYLSKASHEQVFDQLERWYGVEFELVNKPSEEWAVSGEFKDTTLEQVLNSISFSKRFDFQFREDVISIEFKD